MILVQWGVDCKLLVYNLLLHGSALVQCHSCGPLTQSNVQYTVKVTRSKGFDWPSTILSLVRILK